MYRTDKGHSSKLIRAVMLSLQFLIDTALYGDIIALVLHEKDGLNSEVNMHGGSDVKKNALQLSIYP